jgi:hypothetical protein
VGVNEGKRQRLGGWGARPNNKREPQLVSPAELMSYDSLQLDHLATPSCSLDMCQWRGARGQSKRSVRERRRDVAKRRGEQRPVVESPVGGWICMERVRACACFCRTQLIACSATSKHTLFCKAHGHSWHHSTGHPSRGGTARWISERWWGSTRAITTTLTCHSHTNERPLTHALVCKRSHQTHQTHDAHSYAMVH